MKDIVKPVLLEKIVDQANVIDAALNKLALLIHVLAVATAQVIEHNHSAAQADQFIGNMRTDKTSSAGQQRRRGQLIHPSRLVVRSSLPGSHRYSRACNLKSARDKDSRRPRIHCDARSRSTATPCARRRPANNRCVEIRPAS